jgi:diguanylate cyclase (GGDEF)-like protein
MDDEHWVSYLLREQENQELKVKLKNNQNITKTLKASAKEIVIDKKALHIILLDDMTDEIEQINKINEKASIDPLTKIFNRGKFEEILSKEMNLAISLQQPLSVIFADIDHFKKVNDTFGHDVGDVVLQSLAKILQQNMRLGDSVSRWGGEEFVILLQSTPVKQAVKIAEKLRKKVSEYDFDTAGHITISLGVTEYVNDESKNSFIKRVDEALYEAKKTGRDKVIEK